ncbi:MAG: Zn-ribbon domain-containing OB-fold protein [Candidatus Helarchaeota archaeon]
MADSYFQPYISHSMRPFWNGLRDKKLLTLKCVRCSKSFFPPFFRCPFCLKKDLEWIELSGLGILYSWSEVKFVSPPYLIGVVELKEKIGRSIAPIIASSETLKIGQSMQAEYIKWQNMTILAWKPKK